MLRRCASARPGGGPLARADSRGSGSAACSKIGKPLNITVSKQRARKFVKADLAEFDKIYAMAEDVMYDIKKISAENYDSKKVELFLNELYPGQNMDVPDPWSGPESGYHEVYELIDRACDALVENYMITTKQIS